jgi:GT2 family glycosyltransferase
MIPVCPEHAGKKPGTDLGWAYNKMASVVPDGDWILFIDGDALNVSTRYWFRLIERAIAKEPEAGAFVPYTTGLAHSMSGWQMLKHLHGTHDLAAFWKEGWERFTKYGIQMTDVTDIEDINRNYRPFSGVSFCVSKRTWLEIGGSPEGSFTFNDWAIHRKIRAAGKRVYLIKGWLVYHFGHQLRQYSGKPRMGGT